MKRVLAALAAASWLVACGGGTTTPAPTGPMQYDQTQKAVSPKGSIVVRVIDVGTAGPLDGVSVKVLGSDTVGTTNADGVFKFDNMVVNSSYTFIFEKAGYLRARQAAQLQGAAGNSPLENSVTSFSIDLFPANGSVTGFVFLPNGNPAPNATVYVDQRNNLGAAAAESIVTTTTGMDGSFTLMGLATRPTGAFTQVFARWYDENGDMQADYAGTSSNVSLFPGQPGRIFLNYTSIGQQILASNIFDGQVAAGEDLQFTFALPLFTGTLVGMNAAPWTLTHISNSSLNIPVEGTFMSPTELRVKPSLNSLRDGERYSLSLNLRNANGQGTASSFTQNNITFQVRPATVMPFTAQVTGLIVTNGTAVGAPFAPTVFDFSSTNFTVAFVPAVGAVRYELYARDTRNNPNYVLVQGIAATGGARIETTNIFLPNAFNAPFNGQPLAGGNRVNFAVVGIDAYGTRAPLMAATPVEVRDTFPPTASGVINAAPNNPVVDAINDTGAPATIRLRITYSEPMDPMSMVTFTSNATNAPTSAWSWESTTAGILTLTIGANNDAAGSFAIRGGRDAAGNDIVRAGDLVGSLSGRRELLANGEFQMGATCGLGSWTPSTLNNGPAPAAVNNNGAITGSTSACAAVLGSIPGGTPGVGRSRIIQDVTLASLMGTSNAYQFTGRFRGVNVLNPATAGASYTMGCRVTTPADVVVQPLFSANPNVAGYQSSGVIDLSAQAGNTIRIQCDTENLNMMAPGFGAMYLDELSVALVKPGTL